jgi:uncharacterized phiE125 gp8 family phage protein
MANRQMSPPAVEPVTLADAKSHLRVAHSDDDAYITRLISTARSFVEADMMRAVATQIWMTSLDAFPCNSAIRLDFGPVESVTSVIYDDENGLPQTIPAINYELDNQSNPAWVLPVSPGWPTVTLAATNSVRVTYVAGWGGNVPPDVIHAILLMIGELYENREASSERLHTKLPIAVDRLLWNYRTFL